MTKIAEVTPPLAVVLLVEELQQSLKEQFLID